MSALRSGADEFDDNGAANPFRVAIPRPNDGVTTSGVTPGVTPSKPAAAMRARTCKA
jgi:hypothetical protein